MEIILFTGSFEQEASTMDETENKKPGKTSQETMDIAFKTAATDLMGSPTALSVALETPGKKALMEENKIINEILESLQRLGIEIGTTDGKIGEMLENKLTLQEVAELLKQHEAQFEARQKLKDKIKPVTAQKHYMQISKISDLITKDLINQGETDLIVAKKTKQRDEVIITVDLTYQSDDLSISNKFTGYDGSVHNALCSVWQAGNKVITAAQVYRNMNGLSTKKQVPAETIKKITNSINKSRFIEAKIDCTEQVKICQGLEKINKAKISENILNARVITIESGGHEIEAFEIIKAPILYEYNQATGQIISIDTKLLNIPTIDNTEESQVLKMYLIKRIETMKNPKRNRLGINKIKYETMLEEIGFTFTDAEQLKQKKKRLRLKVKKILEHCKEKNLIIGFSEYKIGRNFEGVEIEYKNLSKTVKKTKAN